VASPGFIGGANWSGYAFDPQTNLLFVNTNNLPFRVKLIPSEKFMEESMKGGGEYSSQTGAPYGMFRAPFFSPSYLPCSPPPWGTLTAVDMAEGRIRWQVPLGSMRNFGVAHPIPVPPGSPSLGGPIVTAGGLVFIAGTFDPFMRAFDTATGKEIWKAELPTNGHAVPITYQLTPKGKQYVVIAAGGHAKIKEEPLGDALVAFTLP
jgi:quinoprotein glucose dehydrogenase